MKDPYHCPYCNQRSTRRWNLQVHIKRKHGGPPDPYLASDPLYNHNVQSDQFRSATIADSVGSFQPGYIPQLAPLRTSHYSADPIYTPKQMMYDQRYGTGLSQDTIVKIEELKKHVYKYHQYHNNDPDEIINWAIYCSVNGDNKFLDEKLEQLRIMDRRLNGWS